MGSRYAVENTLPDGTRQIVVVTDKPVSFVAAAADGCHGLSLHARRDADEAEREGGRQDARRDLDHDQERQAGAGELWQGAGATDEDHKEEKKDKKDKKDK